ncbi:Rpn family recombination-promoting nuclease/putative transposase [Rhodocyclus purpureus]|uniref:Rpn family recombination-promoting nuclease/putative transposase n=1 Tax=Rhodocyclus purpureus TaxID=1067 RepID=UPI00191177B8|nr:Rpn family recombination-promoting nuclease/putative transposase [Rhodocyclus purpureus]MBK5915547.1 transposase [Rhodocyclus purpureus]
MPSHDNAYKLIFSHPTMVEDLLRGFVHEEWVNKLDFRTLEKASGSYVSDDLRDREDDIIWRVKQRGEWIYIYLLIEFQSSNDPWMALRIMVYVGLLYQDLIKRKEVSTPSKLPPVFPVVIYNGEVPWTAQRDVADLIESLSGGLDAYRPSIRYHVLDEGRVTDLAEDNTVSDVIRLETGPDTEQLQRVIAALTRRLNSPENTELRRALTVWINRVVLKRLIPGTELPKVNELKEIETMLAERVVTWTENWKREGMQQGMQQGIQQGMQQGMQQGERVLLARLLQRRFGPLSPAIHARLEDATPEQIEQWADNILDATSLEAVFTTH